MNGCFIGPMPGFEDSNLFSEKPIVAILEIEGATQDHEDGTRSINGGKFKLSSFESMSDALTYRKTHESPDNTTTVKIYAFGGGAWRPVNAIAPPN